MYMSRVRLDTRSRETQRALAEPQRMHGALEAAYDGARQRNLWRIDRFDSFCDLLIVSPTILRLEGLADQFAGGDREVCATKLYTPFLDRLAVGQLWQFRLCANPVVAKKNGPGRGEIVPLIHEADQLAWLLDRAPGHGFSVVSETLVVEDDHLLQFKKGSSGHTVSIRQVTYSGLLTVIDPDALREALCTGIGREKAYGCGLLTLVRPR